MPNSYVLIDRFQLQSLKKEMEFLKVENEKITELNRSLTQDLDVYKNKDTLKEA